jgi:hypothetical protein
VYTEQQPHNQLYITENLTVTPYTPNGGVPVTHVPEGYDTLKHEKNLKADAVVGHNASGLGTSNDSSLKQTERSRGSK